MTFYDSAWVALQGRASGAWRSFQMHQMCQSKN